MEMPIEVMVHCDILGLKGTKARLLQVSPHGYYEVNLQFGDRRHRTLLPIARTILIDPEPEDGGAELVKDIER